MGYNLYVTRRKDWWDEAGPSISVEEWRAYVAGDAELRMDASLGEHTALWSGSSEHESPWIAWNEGNLESKYPDPLLVKKMAAIAEALGARLKGEESETYDEHAQPQVPPPPTRSQKIGTWWRNLFARPITPLNESEVPFKVGDRVREIFGSKRQGTVTRIDLRAEHGLGLVTVKYDDGREISSAAGQPGLEKCE